MNDDDNKNGEDGEVQTPSEHQEIQSQQNEVGDVMSEFGTFSGIVSREGVNDEEIIVSAKNRDEAVAKILVIFREKGYRDAKKYLVIPDPLGEVVYDEQMKCSDSMLNYLPGDVADRVIEESNGELGRDPDFPNSRYQLKRLKTKNYKKMQREGKLVRQKKGSLPPVVLFAPFINKKVESKSGKNVWKDSVLAKEGSRPPTVVPAWTPHVNDGAVAKILPLRLHQIVQKSNS